MLLIVWARIDLMAKLACLLVFEKYGSKAVRV